MTPITIRCTLVWDEQLTLPSDGELVAYMLTDKRDAIMSELPESSLDSRIVSCEAHVLHTAPGMREIMS